MLPLLVLGHVHGLEPADNDGAQPKADQKGGDAGRRRTKGNVAEQIKNNEMAFK